VNRACSPGVAKERTLVGSRACLPSHSAGGTATDPDPTRLEDNEVAEESLTALLHQLQDTSRKIRAGPRREPKRENATRRGLVGME
jgi:hypothetical protein